MVRRLRPAPSLRGAAELGGSLAGLGGGAGRRARWRAFPRPPVAGSCQAALLSPAAGVAAAVWLRNSQLEIDCASRAALRM